MGICIGIRLPAVQREKRHFNAKANDEHRHGQQHIDRVKVLGDERSHVLHVQGAGNAI